MAGGSKSSGAGQGVAGRRRAGRQACRRPSRQSAVTGKSRFTGLGSPPVTLFGALLVTSASWAMHTHTPRVLCWRYWVGGSDGTELPC